MLRVVGGGHLEERKRGTQVGELGRRRGGEVGHLKKMATDRSRLPGLGGWMGELKEGRRRGGGGEEGGRRRGGGGEEEERWHNRNFC